MLREKRVVYGKKWSVDTEAEHEQHIKVLLDAVSCRTEVIKIIKANFVALALRGQEHEVKRKETKARASCEQVRH